MFKTINYYCYFNIKKFTLIHLYFLIIKHNIFKLSKVVYLIFQYEFRYNSTSNCYNTFKRIVKFIANEINIEIL